MQKNINDAENVPCLSAKTILSVQEKEEEVKQCLDIANFAISLLLKRAMNEEQRRKERIEKCTDNEKIILEFGVTGWIDKVEAHDRKIKIINQKIKIYDLNA